MTVPAEPYGLYVHIPFCRTRCTYCAFNTYTGLESLYQPYVRALESEIRFVAHGAGAAGGLSSHTLFFGGGTSSLLTPEQIARIIDTCRVQLGLTADAEISLEANPGTVDAGRLAGYRAAGVNRLSIGVQSAHPDELDLFGRGHTFAEAKHAFRLAGEAGFDSLNLDLIYGAPHQTRQGWRDTLDAVLAWKPDHVALYALTLEPGTSLHHRVRQGLLPDPDPDLAADMYDDARRWLDRAGLRQYEISNWARPGHECQHNRQYWLNRPFLGFGAGAHGAAAGLRYWNVESVPDYLARLTAKDTPDAPRYPLSPAADGHEVIDGRLARAETMMLSLRLVREGVSQTSFARRYGHPPDHYFGPALSHLEQTGFLAPDGDTLRLTDRAYLVSNRVLAHFF